MTTAHTIASNLGRTITDITEEDHTYPNGEHEGESINLTHTSGETVTITNIWNKDHAAITRYIWFTQTNHGTLTTEDELAEFIAESTR